MPVPTQPPPAEELADAATQLDEIIAKDDDFRLLLRRIVKACLEVLIEISIDNLLPRFEPPTDDGTNLG